MSGTVACPHCERVHADPCLFEPCQECLCLRSQHVNDSGPCHAVDRLGFAKCGCRAFVGQNGPVA